ncbi:ABC transporter ATP-binding protein [Polymorphum gilvum]|uniref:ABC branched-chain amino acid family transporter, ATPase subunit n=1 Tax=Polymorphum gilvum (strain LMG 25793 / CGMCC 1.9160 / SL003B-26A1) TaxID=991905 RepID=F2J5J7_POLGS|nr:ABC transporter ATP-binding protein [Polymorphum gilvum]ADZ72367.1 ABC branched-chain amino acid family transporter, ATPase subunit [Polymorphum gilvum SL003B-26A1]
MLEIKGLSAAYGQHRALEDVNLRVDRGEIVVILGANGAGKSTLLKAISGICEGQVGGSVVMQGTELLGMAANRIVEEGIALVPEGRGVFGDLTVAENLTLGAYANRAREEEAGNLERVLRLFPKLRERRGQQVRTMSGGEQQMVAIGRAMMSNPALLTLDEPSLGLSPLLCKELFQSLKTVRDAGIGILLVEQNARQSLAIADRGYLIENGRILQEGKAAELRNDPAVQAAYLGGGNKGARSAAARPAGPVAPPSPARPDMARRPPDVEVVRAVAPAVQDQSRPIRPSGPAPDEIAAAALASLPRPQAAQPAPQPTRPISEPARPAVPPAPARTTAGAASQPRPAERPASPPAAVRGAADALLGGLSIGDLVAQASEESRARYGASQPSPPPRPRASAPTPMPVPVLEPGRSDTRLNAVLSEIEDAAARARAWRSGSGQR